MELLQNRLKPVLSTIMLLAGTVSSSTADTRAVMTEVPASLMLKTVELSEPDLLRTLLSLNAVGVRTITASDRAVVSPDGKWMAYSIISRGKAPLSQHHTGARARDMIPAGAQVYVRELASGRTVEAVGGSYATWLPSWAPDSQRLAFVSSDDDSAAYPWVLEIESWNAKRVTNRPLYFGLNDIPRIQWTPDNKEIIASFEPNELKQYRDSVPSTPYIQDNNDKARVTVLQSGADQVLDTHFPSPNGREGFVLGKAAVAAISVESRIERLLPTDASNAGAGEVIVSPSGAWGAFVSPPRNAVASSRGKRDASKIGEIVADITIARADRDGVHYTTEANVDYPNGPTVLPFWVGDEKFLFTRAGQLFQSVHRGDRFHTSPLTADHVRALTVAVSSNGSDVVAVTGYTGTSAAYDKPTGLVWISRSEGPKTISIPKEFQFDSIVTSGEGVLWQPEPETITLICRNRLNPLLSVLLRMELRSQKSRVLWQDIGRLKPVDLVHNTSSMVSAFESPSEPLDLWLFSSAGEREERVTESNPAARAVRVGRVEYLTTPVPLWDGQFGDVHSAVILPSRNGGSFPAVVTMYPDDEKSARANTFGAGAEAGVPTAFLLAQGYAVIYADLPTRPRNTTGDRAKESVDVLLPQIYAAASRGYIDINRVALFGWSQGGYTAALIASRTNLFKAVICGGGMYDLPGQYGYMEKGADSPSRWAELGLSMGLPPWDALERYVVNSPYYQVKRITSPMLLLVGDMDSESVVVEQRKMFAALQTYNKSAELAVYEGEGHTLFGGQLANSIDASKRVVGFLNRYVCNNCGQTK